MLHVRLWATAQPFKLRIAGGTELLAMYVVKSPKNVYTYVRQILEGGNKVEYLTTSPREILTRDITRHWASATSFIESKQLAIRAAVDYFPTEGTRRLIIPKATGSSRLSKSKNSVVILCPAAVASYLKTIHVSNKQFGTTVSKVNRIIELETAVGQQFLDNLIVCCLFERFFRGLEAVPLLLLLKYHKIAIRSKNVISVSEDEVLDAIKRGMDSTMGENTSLLVFKTLFHVYKIDESYVLQDPEIWYGKLAKLLGTRSHDLIQRAITDEIGKIILPDTAHHSSSGR